MGLPGLLLISTAASSLLASSSIDLCLRNPVNIDRFTMQALQSELSRILTASGRPANFQACRPGIISITLRNDPPDEETTALGGIRVNDNRLLPEIELFVAPTSRIIGNRLPGVLGRALARVATHELGHWLYQGSTHSHGGIMIAQLSAAHLLAPDSRFFRLPPAD